MPTILRSGPYRFYFYSHEPNEPPHVPMDRENLSAKFWLNPVSLAQNQGFRPKELQQVQALMEESRQRFLEARNDYFGVGQH